MTLTPADLERIEALLERATPGPWKAYGTWVAEVTAHADGNPEAPDTRLLETGEFDADTIVELRNSAPALIALARRALELESALLFFNAINFDGHGWHPDRIVELARRQGWPGLQSEGGKEQDG